MSYDDILNYLGLKKQDPSQIPDWQNQKHDAFLNDWLGQAKDLGQNMAGINPLGKAEQAVIQSAEKVPYKLKYIYDEDAIKLESPKAKGSIEFRDPDTVNMLDPEMNDFIGERPAYINTLEAEKGYGAKALNKLEQAAKKRGADSVYLNASPLNGTRGLNQEQAAQKLKEFYSKNGYQTALDQGTNTMMYKKLGLLPLGYGLSKSITNQDDEEQAKLRALTELMGGNR